MPRNRSSNLGSTLKTVRELLGRSLKAVAEPADISTAYLVKLERNEVTTPSPHVLHRLSGVLGVDYQELMELAGYVVPAPSGARMSPLTQALASEDLSDEEARALATYLQVYRRGKR